MGPGYMHTRQTHLRCISNDRQLATFRDIGPLSQMTNPTFVRMSYLGADLASTIAIIHNESLALLIIAPVPNNVNIATITRELVMLGTQPVFGPTTNFKKVAPEIGRAHV